MMKYCKLNPKVQSFVLAMQKTSSRSWQIRIDSLQRDEHNWTIDLFWQFLTVVGKANADLPTEW